MLLGEIAKARMKTTDRAHRPLDPMTLLVPREQGVGRLANDSGERPTGLHGSSLEALNLALGKLHLHASHVHNDTR